MLPTPVASLRRLEKGNRLEYLRSYGKGGAKLKDIKQESVKDLKIHIL
jgi:hypothetical protein